MAVVRGLTQLGLDTEKAGSTPSTDLYGVRHDGTVSNITADLGTYEFGLAADASTVLASPYATVINPQDFDPVAGPGPSLRVTGSVLALDLSTGERSVVLENDGGYGHVALSPDTTFLAVTDVVPTGALVGGHIRLGLVALDETGEVRRAPRFDPGLAQDDLGPVWSPDGKQVAYVAVFLEQPEDATTSADVWELRVQDVASGAERAVHRYAEGSRSSSADWSPDGQSLLTLEVRTPDTGGQKATQVLEIDAETGEARVILESTLDNLGDVEYSSADGSTITGIGTAPDLSGVVAGTWGRSPGGMLSLESSVGLGGKEGLLGADHIEIPSCALS